MSSLIRGPCFALITGASRGLGRAITLGLSATIEDNSVLALTARNVDGLQKTIEMARRQREKARKGDIEFRLVSADLANKQDISKLHESCLDGLPSNRFSSALLIHNTGTLGDITKEVCDYTDPSEVTEYFQTNVSHLPPLTAAFMRWRDQQLGDGENNTAVVNISSTIFKTQSNPCFSLYSSGKAAREILFRVFAEENPNVRVLNWAPGSLDGGMIETVLSTENKYDTGKVFTKIREEGKLISLEDSVTKLLYVLEKNQFTSGSHLDYSDVINAEN